MHRAFADVSFFLICLCLWSPFLWQWKAYLSKQMFLWLHCDDGDGEDDYGDDGGWKPQVKSTEEWHDSANFKSGENIRKIKSTNQSPEYQKHPKTLYTTKTYENHESKYISLRSSKSHGWCGNFWQN